MDLGKLNRDWLIGLALSLFAVFAWIYAYGLFHYPITVDMGMYLYGAQELLRGNFPYLHVFDVKPPLTFLISGSGLLIFSNGLNLSQILASRITMLLFGAGTIFFTYLITSEILESKLAGVLTCLILLSFSGFGWASLSGRPKILTIFFGMLAIYALQKKRFLLAGLSSSLATLAWLPGGAFIIASSVIVGYGREGKAIAKWLCGVLIPLVVVALLFLAGGAFHEMVKQSVLFAITTLSSRPDSLFSRGVLHYKDILFVYRAGAVFFLLGGLGFLSMLRDYEKIFDLNKGSTAVFLSFLLLVIYTLFDKQGWPDYIPLLPFLAIFSTVFLKGVSRFFNEKFVHSKPDLTKAGAVFVAVTLVVSLFALVPVFRTNQNSSASVHFLDEVKEELKVVGKLEKARYLRDKGNTLKLISFVINEVGFRKVLSTFFSYGYDGSLAEQERIGNLVDNLTEENERVLSLHAPTILFISQEKSACRYPLMAKAEISYIDNVEGGIEEFSEKIKEREPKIIVSRGNLEEKLRQLRINTFVKNKYYKIEKNRGSYVVLLMKS